MSLAKTAAIAGASYGAGTLFSGVGTATEQATAAAAENGGGFFATGGINHWIGETFQGWSGVGMSTLSAGMQTALTTTSNLAINSFELEDGRLAFDGGGFTSSLTSMTTWASTAAAMTAAFTGGALGQANLKSGDGDLLNGDTFNTKAIQKLNNFTGSLAGAGVSYAMTGEATLNVANLKDFTRNGNHNLGLLELHLGGETGFSVNLGTGGTDVSYSTVAGAMAGVRDSSKIIGAKLNALGGNIEDISTLNAINMMGWTGNGLNQKIARAIWDDALKVAYGDIGEEYLGKYKGGDVVTIRKTLLGGGREGSAKLATVMAHEGTHVDGNRIEGIAHIQGAGTYGAINGMFGLEGDSAFSAQMIYAILNPESWKENTGDTDYWKLKFFEDGRVELVDDERSSLYIDTVTGGEFKLWDIDELSIEEAKMRIIGGYPQPENGLLLSGETMKRLGMYTILNANSNNLSSEQFEDIAAKSYLSSNGLGYYIDFSNALAHINQNLPAQYYSNANKSLVRSPDYSYSFNPATIANIFIYGTMSTLGYTATVDGAPLFTKQNNSYPQPEYHIETDDGNLPTGWEQIRDEYNNQDVKFKRAQPPVTRLIGIPDVIPQSPDKPGAFGNAFISGMQFVDGAVKAKNINNIYVNTWNVFGQSFFTMQTTVFSSMQSTNAKYIYKFVTAEESKTRRFENAAKEYLKKDGKK
jgi:hypothetical protein